MNGFEAELRERILGMTAHATLVQPFNFLRGDVRFQPCHASRALLPQPGDDDFF
jgi:ABC-type lipoprotein release transport system permease subunit